MDDGNRYDEVEAWGSDESLTDSESSTARWQP
jgi:hypothetical protein